VRRALLGLAVLAAAGLGLGAQQEGPAPTTDAAVPGAYGDAVKVASWLGAAAQPAVEQWLGELAGDGLAWELVPTGVDADVLLGAPLVELWAASSRAALEAREDWGACPAKGIAADGTFAIAFVEPSELVWAETATDFGAGPVRVEDLLWERAFDQQVVLVEPAGFPELWLGWRVALTMAYGSQKAKAWLVRLDGRVARYEPSVEDAVGALMARPGSVSLLPRTALAGVAGLVRRVPEDGAPDRTLGFALRVGAPPRAALLLQRLLRRESLARLAAAAEISLAGSELFADGAAVDSTAAGGMAQWWQQEVRGRGAELESLDGWIDTVLGIAFVLVMLVVFVRLRRSEAESA